MAKVVRPPKENIFAGVEQVIALYLIPMSRWTDLYLQIPTHLNYIQSGHSKCSYKTRNVQHCRRHIFTLALLLQYDVFI